MASQSMDIVAKALEHQVLQSARMVEEQLDAELGKLDRMDEDELERLKERRMDALKKAQKQKQVRCHVCHFIPLMERQSDNTAPSFRLWTVSSSVCLADAFWVSHSQVCLNIPQEWLSKGHGEYREIPSEKDFFPEVKDSKNVVCHFYRDSTFRLVAHSLTQSNWYGGRLFGPNSQPHGQ